MSDVPTLAPKPGFDWSQVNWGGPKQRRTDRCSYCDNLFNREDDDFIPLILWNNDGWCAEFCHDCQRKWWGLEW
jgi:hypothetical protein